MKDNNNDGTTSVSMSDGVEKFDFVLMIPIEDFMTSISVLIPESL
jgi:hypothetical protein